MRQTISIATLNGLRQMAVRMRLAGAPLSECGGFAFSGQSKKLRSSGLFSSDSPPSPASWPAARRPSVSNHCEKRRRKASLGELAIHD